MKRNYEDPSLELIGRSAAERRLDRFYNRQRSQLQNPASQGRVSIDSRSRETKDLPFKSNDSSTASSAPKPRSDVVTAQKGVKDILSDILNRHLPRRSRFAKSVQLLTKLSVSYLDDRNNAEFACMGLDDFLRVYFGLGRIFVMEFGGNIPKDALDVKDALADFMESVVERLDTDCNLSNCERQFLRLLRMNIGYSASLWYENDSFRFHGVVSKLEAHLTDFETLASQPDLSRDSESPTDSSDLESEKRDPHDADNVVSSDLPSIGSFKDEVDASANASPAGDAVSCDSAPHDSSNNATSSASIAAGVSTPAADGHFKLPGEHHLIKLQKQAFVRTLAVVFRFFSFPWARTSIETLFQRVYLKRDMFCETDQKRITEWQQEIKASKGKSFKGTSRALGISEANFQVKDAREEKIVSVHGSQVWCNRQYGI